MFGMRKRRLAESAATPSREYGPGSAAYSPNDMSQADADSLGRPAYGNQGDEPVIPDAVRSQQETITPRVGLPPDPAEGGEPGVRRALGWSTGLLPSRAMRERFDGKTLVVPTMGVHPAVGPVGVSSRSDRLQAGVSALVDQWLPSQQKINESFTQARNRNPLDKD